MVKGIKILVFIIAVIILMITCSKKEDQTAPATPVEDKHAIYYLQVPEMGIEKYI